MSRHRNRPWHLAAASMITVALALAGCNRKTLYHHYEHTPLAGWEKSDTLYFSVKPNTSRTTIRRDVELRITSAYPFKGLNLVVEQTALPSQQSRHDTIDCRLTDDEGYTLGNGITLYQYRFELPDATINQGDSLRLSIRHNMKRETLPGIADIGIRLTTY